MATIFGTSGNDTLTGTSGNDSIYGQAGDDTLTGGLGNDTLQGGLGSDTYVFNLGDGQDTVFDNGAGSGEINTLQFGSAIAPAQVSVKESGSGDLVLTITGTTDKIMLRSQLLSAAGGVDQVVFADGTVWNRAALLTLATAPTSGNDTFYGDYTANTLNGGAGNDTLSGGAGDDTLTGGAGNDTLSGGTGNDTYLFNAGDGQDTINDNGASSGELNTLQLGAGILPGAVTVVEANGSDLVISFTGSTDKITLRSQLLSASGGVDQVVFADGTVWNRAALLAAATAPTSGNDTFYGDYAANTLSGGAGDDTLNGGAGDDTLSGGTGNDTMIGGVGNDTYLFNRGDGRDTILDNGTGGSGEMNTLQLGAGIAVGDVIVTAANGGSDLVLSIAGSTDAVILKNQLLAKTGGVDQVVFIDGTVWTRATLLAFATAPTSGNDTIYGDYTANTLSGAMANDAIYGRSGDDVLSGDAGDDYLEGGVGNDTYLFALGDGHDRILDNGAAGEVDTLQFGSGIAATDVIVTQANGGNDIILTIAGANDSVTLSNQFTGATGGVDRVQFADGTVWDRSTLVLKSLVPTAGDDVLGGDGGANTLTGGAGNDTLIGRGGADTYSYTLGGGRDIIDDRGTSDSDTLQLHGISAADVHVVRSGDNAILVFEGDSNSRLTLAQQFNGIGTIERVEFDDGTVWTDADILAKAASGPGGNIILGTDVADTVIGTTGDDTIDGLGGNDQLQGGAGNDTYIFNLGDGQDSIVESSGVDTLSFGTGITASNVLLQAVGDNLVVRFRNSDDSIVVQSAFSNAGSAVESARFSDGTLFDFTQPLTFTYVGTPGNTMLTGSAHGTNVFELGAGGDTVTAGSANDIVVFGHGVGHATVNLVGVGATLKLAAGISAADVTTQIAANGDLTFSLAGSGDSVTFVGASSKGLTTILFDDGTIWRRINGTSGNDTMTGQTTDDTLTGGLGNDQLNGGAGSDSYVYSSGDGNDVITDSTASNGSVDKVVFTNIAASRVSLSRSGGDVTLVIAPSAPGATDGGSVVLKGQVDGASGQGIEQIVFADGTTWSSSDLLQMLVSVAGTSGNDTLNGTSGSDIIRGGLGNDTLSGAGGADTYLYSRGDGNDVIAAESGGNFDKLVLRGPADVSLVRNGNHLTLVIAESAPGAGDGGSIQLNDELEWWYDRGIEQVVFDFDNGTVWTANDLRAKVLAQASTSGNDTIVGFNTADVLQGGAGNDTLNGASGDDTYVYARGDGNDVITENSGNLDKLVLHGIAPGNVSLVRNGNHVTLVIAESAPGAGDGGSIQLNDELEWNYDRGIEQVVFDNGTVWTPTDLRVMLLAQASTSGNDTIVGFNTADVLQGGAGNDTLNGASGDDTYVYARGDGNDVITENNGNLDKLVLHGVAPSAVSLVRDGIHLTLVIAESAPGAGDGGSIQLRDELDWWYDRGIEQIVFDNGTVWTPNDLRVKVLAQASTSGNDTIIGFNTEDTLQGGTGNDLLSGLSGSDTYIYTRGDGNDVINDQSSSGTNSLVLHGVAPGELTVVRNGDGAILLIGAGGIDGSITIRGQFNGAGPMSSIRFDDGTVWTAQTLSTIAIANDGSVLTHAGTSGVDTIIGTSDIDVIDGGAAGDTLRGEGGSDVYRWGIGSGNDTIIENGSGSDSDIIRLTGLNLADVSFGRLGNDLYITAAATGEVLKVQGHFNGTGTGIEQIRFADNTTWNRDQIASAAWYVGSAGNDSITGTSANDTFKGNQGNDYLRGNGGSDTYVYSSGHGNDEIDDESGSVTEVDVLKFENLNSNDVTLSRAGEHLYVAINPTGETIKIDYQFNSQTANWGIEQFQFANGETWNLATINANAWIRGTSGNDTLNGSNWNDTFRGGLGNDQFNSGAGSDTYVYGLGDGNDYINDESGSTTDIDVLRLTDLNTSDLTFSRVGVNLVATVNSNGQTITFDEQFYSQTANWGLERIEFADGTTWNLATINANAWIRGTSGNDTLNGSNWNDTFKGGLGNDQFNSGAGSDTYVYALGDGNDYINDESGSTTDIDVLRFTDLNASDLTFSRVGVNLVATVNSNGQTITFDEQFYSQTANWGLEKIEFANGETWNLATINASAWYRGTSGNDTMSGSAWNDTLAGGAGNDTMSGGAGSDTFVFRANLGQDVVTDFSAGTDVLEFRDGVFSDAAAALAAATSSGSDTLITIDASNTVLLKNVSLANLHEADFHIV